MNTIYAALMCLSAAATYGNPSCHNIYGNLEFATRAECESFFRSHWGGPVDAPGTHYGCYARSVPAWTRLD